MSGGRPWSLTRRLSVTFALTTSVIVALYGAWSGYLFFDAVRDETRRFLRHEIGELALHVEHTDGSREQIARGAEQTLAVPEHPPIALRIRDRRDHVLFEGGRARLLRAADGPIGDDGLPNAWFFTRRVAGWARSVDDPPVRIELIVDTGGAIGALVEYASAVGLTFLFAVLLSAVAGYYTARRGLATLRRVVRRTQEIGPFDQETRLPVEGAPREVREVADALEDLLVRIRSGMAEMRLFTAGLAHELRSPLTNLIGSTEVALLKPRTAEEYHELLREHLDELQELSEAVDNLVAYCRSSDPDRRELRSERFDFASEARIRLHSLERRAAAAGVSIELSSEGATEMEGDREDCLRVLKNLVANAIALAPRGTSVRVRLEGGEEDIRLVVEDEGPGVPPDLAERIYEPFVSGRPRAGKRASYGLGLTICKRIVEEHGGWLWHENLEPRGTRFVATFRRTSRTSGEAVG